MSKAKLLALLTTTLAVCCLLPPVRAEVPEGPAKAYVVLVGVSKFADPQIKPRPHAEDDAKALYDVFTNKDYLGVQADHVRLLLGTPDEHRKSEPATHANVVKAAKWAATQAGRDDLIVFAYIGQGAALSDAGTRLGYFASDSTLKDREKNAIAAAELAEAFAKLKTSRFCAFVDVNFKGYEAGPVKMSDPVLGASAYREFLGADGKEDEGYAHGHALFLATVGLTPSLDLEKNGVFTHVVAAGLKGAADKDGYEPDGVITVDELAEYVEKEVPELARTKGKSREEKRQHARVIESIGTHFILTHNPAVYAKAAKRLEKLDELAKDKKISEEIFTEGKTLLTRMPKLKAQQELRKSFQKLVDGVLTPAEFEKEREKTLAALKLPRPDAWKFASKVIQSTQIIRDNYVKEVNQGEMVAWAIRGIYRQIDEKLPAEVREKLDKVKDMTEADLAALLADVRERLGTREDLSNHKDLDFALQRMLAHLDPHTTYIDPETLTRFTTETTGKFRGIGISIRPSGPGGQLQVVTPLMGSPAYRKGVKAGDVITTIIREVDAEGKPLAKPEVIATKGLTSNDAVKYITGKPGTKVKIVVERKGEPKPITFEIPRAEVEMETVMGYKRQVDDQWDFTIDPENKICYVRLSSFARNTARDLARVLKKLHKEGINGFVLDLRNNPGGLLSSAVEISDMFVDDGLIVTIRPRIGREVAYPGEHEGSYLNFPMVCLVDNRSASGSEIVSACLQDHKRAVVMGERSYGKGSVQTIQPFEGGELKLTTASFWRPSGKNLNKSSTTGKESDEWGVTPDKGYVLKLSEKEREQLYEAQHDAEIIPRRDAPPEADEKKPEFKDRQLEMALDYLKRQIKIASKYSAKKAG